MQSRAARAITKAVVAAGTAGAIATACWLLNRILDGSDDKRIEDGIEYVDTKDTDIDSDNEYDKYYSEQELDANDSFALLPVVSESDDESDEDALGYTADYFTPQHDVCVLSISVQTLVDPLPDILPSDCRLCRAVESCDASSEDLDLGGKLRALSFTESDSSDGSVFSFISELNDPDEHEMPVQRTRAHSRLYVRL
ncbi:hypothetical protein V7S43_012829 [Phytophthora oleae]|uniref:Uncharacterized protein n=1 Tax=Phytophthora oleae TaxID=2107226 RepID=A0ABD3F6C7_9STRA